MTHPMIALIVIIGGIIAFLLLIGLISAGARHKRSGDSNADGTSSWLFTDNSSHHDGGHHHGGHDSGGHSGGGFDGGGGHGGH